MLSPFFTALSLSSVVAALRPPLLVQEPLDRIEDVKVPVVLGVMSRCPDAHLCETVFDRVLHGAASKMDLSLSYLGTIDSSEPDFGVTCMHGPDECAGNVQQLCAAKYAPLEQWWEFVQCHNYQGRDKIGKPDVALRCAKSARIDWKRSGVGQCAGMDGSGKAEEGVKLLQESVKATEAMDVEKSCTIIINANKVCIRDDGTWKGCEAGHAPADFIRQINEEYRRLNSNSESGSLMISDMATMREK